MGRIFTMKQQVYTIIRQRIADGTYRHGQKLQENDVANDLNVSRSPVREALKQLVIEGILVETPNKGVTIRSFTEHEIQDIYAVKRQLELYALEYLADHPELLPKKSLHDVKTSILSAVDRDVDYLCSPEINPHFVFVEAVGNSFLSEMHHRTDFYTTSYHRALFAGVNYQVNISQHLEIVNALLAEDYSLARVALLRHLHNSQEIICKAIREDTI